MLSPDFIKMMAFYMRDILNPHYRNSSVRKIEEYLENLKHSSEYDGLNESHLLYAVVYLVRHVGQLKNQYSDTDLIKFLIDVSYKTPNFQLTTPITDAERTSMNACLQQIKGYVDRNNDLAEVISGFILEAMKSRDPAQLTPFDTEQPTFVSKEYLALLNLSERHLIYMSIYFKRCIGKININTFNVLSLINTLILISEKHCSSSQEPFSPLEQIVVSHFLGAHLTVTLKEYVEHKASIVQRAQLYKQNIGREYHINLTQEEQSYLERMAMLNDFVELIAITMVQCIQFVPDIATYPKSQLSWWIQEHLTQLVNKYALSESHLISMFIHSRRAFGTTQTDIEKLHIFLKIIAVAFKCPEQLNETEKLIFLHSGAQAPIPDQEYLACKNLIIESVQKQERLTGKQYRIVLSGSEEINESQVNTASSANRAPNDSGVGSASYTPRLFNPQQPAAVSMLNNEDDFKECLDPFG